MLAQYVTLETAPNRWPEVGRAVEALAGREAGAAITAGFAVQIGGSINTVPVLLRAATQAELDAALEAMTAMADLAAWSTTPLCPVSERNLSALRPDDGVYTNRWFHVRATGTPEFEEETLEAWDAFEARTGTDVVGLWKSAACQDVVSYLLIARYDNLDAWDKSRFFNRKDDQHDADWMARFQRRREMMTDSSVMTTRCLFGPGGSSVGDG